MRQPERSTVVVLLAAGAGTRFEDARHKLLVPLPATAYRGAETVVERSLAHAVDADVGPVVVVTGAAAEAVTAAVTAAVNAMVADRSFASSCERVSVCHNDRWAEGQVTSLHAGIDAARSLGATDVVVGLADQPGIGLDAWRAVAGAEGSIVVATYDGRRRNPVKLDRSVWSLLPATGDEGARALMRVRPELVREVPCTGHPADIDTTEDLRRWQNN